MRTEMLVILTHPFWPVGELKLICAITVADEPTGIVVVKFIGITMV